MVESYKKNETHEWTHICACNGTICKNRLKSVRCCCVF